MEKTTAALVAAKAIQNRVDVGKIFVHEFAPIASWHFPH